MDARVCYLDEQFRHSDSSLEKILNEMRSGNISPETRATLRKMCDEKSLEAKGVVPTRLYTHNVDVDAENERELEKLAGSSRLHEMSSNGKAHIVEALKKGILAPETLRPKKKSGGDVYKKLF